MARLTTVKSNRCATRRRGGRILFAAAGLAIAAMVAPSAVSAQSGQSNPNDPFGNPRPFNPGNPGNPGNPNTPGNPGQPRRDLPPGGYIRPGPNYASISEYLLGMWQFPTKAGAMRILYQRSGRFLTARPGTNVVLIGIWRARGARLQMKFQRRCRREFGEMNCRAWNNQRVYNMRVQPVTRRTMRVNNAVWRRLR